MKAGVLQHITCSTKNLHRSAPPRELTSWLLQASAEVDQVKKLGCIATPHVLRNQESGGIWTVRIIGVRDLLKARKEPNCGWCT